MIAACNDWQHLMAQLGFRTIGNSSVFINLYLTRIGFAIDDNMDSYQKEYDE
jgi:hypothetical protein